MSDLVGIRGDATPFLMTVGGVVYVVIAGQREQHVARITVDGRRALVGAGAWISEPVPMVPGMRPRIVWLGPDGNIVRDVRADPLDPHRLAPIFGPEWTSYAPLS